MSTSLTEVEIFYSDRATFYTDDTDFGSGIKRCLGDDQIAATCDWDTIFATSLPDEYAQDITAEMTVVSYPVAPAAGQFRDGAMNDEDPRRIYAEHVIQYDFTNYSLDSSMAHNSVNEVRLMDLGRINGTSIAYDPDWLLAAWSADREGVSQARLAQDITNYVKADWNYMTDPSIELQGFVSVFRLLHLYSVAQSVSMVRYEYVNYNESDFRVPLPKGARVLHKSALRKVWAYGLGSRSSKFSVIVAIMGLSCTVLRPLIALFSRDRRKARQPVDFLAAALKYQYRDEFEELDRIDDEASSDGRTVREVEKKVARVRFRLGEDESGSLKFMKPGEEQEKDEEVVRRVAGFEEARSYHERRPSGEFLFHAM